MDVTGTRLIAFSAVKECNPALIADIDKLIEQAFFQIERDRQRALASEKEALRNQQTLQRALIQADMAQQQSVIALKQAEMAVQRQEKATFARASPLQQTFREKALAGEVADMQRIALELLETDTLKAEALQAAAETLLALHLRRQPRARAHPVRAGAREFPRHRGV